MDGVELGLMKRSSSHRTGLPKGVPLTHRGMVSASLATIVPAARVALRQGGGIPEPDPNQKSYLLAIPLFHVTGCCNISLTMTLTGGKLVLMRKWDASIGRSFFFLPVPETTAYDGFDRA